MGKNFINLIITNLIVLIFIKKSFCKQCDLEDFRYIDRKVFCETDNGVSTSCLGTPFPVKRAYVMCTNKYHNDNNITALTIDCQDDGTWTDKIFTCRPECDDSTVSFNLIDNPKVEYPPWYAEVVELNSNKTVKNIYPGVILAERNVLTKKEYLKDNFDKTNFIIRIPRLKYNNKPKEYDIDYEDKGSNNHKLFLSVVNETEKETAQTTTVIHINPIDYIKFDDVTLPACDKIYPKEVKGTLKLLHFENRLNYPRWYEKILPLYEANCFIPRVDYKKMEVACFNDKSGPPTECKNRADSALLRCQIGYEQTNSSTSDHIARCSFVNRWFYRYGEMNDCKLVCGETDVNLRPRQTNLIHRGSKTHNGFAPWHVAIYFNDKNTIKQICGGSIIHSNTILSAAHCFYNVGTGKINEVSKYLIAAGKFYRQYETYEESEHYADVISINIPPNYEPLPIKNDIAVVILDHHMQYTPYIKPICIDFSSDIIPPDVEGHIIGWGATSIDDEQSNELLVANLITLTNQRCKAVVGPRNRNEITNEKFCAINDKGSSACQGDSGGGYVAKRTVDGKDRYFLLGVISIGLNSEKYCSDGFTTVFTNILLYEDFIKNRTSLYRSISFFKNIESKYPANNYVKIV